jgi:hypothetical protein
MPERLPRLHAKDFRRRAWSRESLSWRAEVFEVFPCRQLHAEDFRETFPGKAFHVPSLRENKGNMVKQEKKK